VDTALVGVTDGAIARLLGDELRRARDAIGLTRQQLVDRMDSDIHPQTLASYEKGARQCTVARLVEICRALGISAPDVLALSLQRAKTELYAITLLVDLTALLRDENATFARVRTWARMRIENESDNTGQGTVAWLEPPVIREMAFTFGLPHVELIKYLAMFTPPASPRS
jgi:transcriptional regulator with XRE-family HTH domain